MSKFVISFSINKSHFILTVKILSHSAPDQLYCFSLWHWNWDNRTVLVKHSVLVIQNFWNTFSIWLCFIQTFDNIDNVFEVKKKKKKKRETMHNETFFLPALTYLMYKIFDWPFKSIQSKRHIFNIRYGIKNTRILLSHFLRWRILPIIYYWYFGLMKLV